MAAIGSKGGQATGPTKARDPAHYKRLAAIRKRNAKRRAAREPS
jgi:general stress protein YciG